MASIQRKRSTSHRTGKRVSYLSLMWYGQYRDPQTLEICQISLSRDPYKAMSMLSDHLESIGSAEQVSMPRSLPLA